MLNLTNMVKAPIYSWEVAMDRCRSINAYQNSRSRIAYVKAHNADEAMKAAKKQHPQFKPTSARKV